MTCANHPTTEVTACCQQCGKPLCKECARPVGGMIFCEPCLQARLGMAAGGPETFAGAHPNAALAGLLGFIPGVGAMYNGQFAKALAHVLIFAIFVSLADKSVIFSMLLVAWIFYQAFDAYQTAKARRDGLPLPNPFGLNDLGSRMGVSYVPPPPPTSWASEASSGVPPSATPEQTAQQPGAPPFSSYTVSSPTYSPPATPPPVAPLRAPVGAIVLIVIGLLLLFQTLGIMSGVWLSRGWPLLIVGLGVWLLYRRMRETPPGGPQ